VAVGIEIFSLLANPKAFTSKWLFKMLHLIT